MNEPYAPAPGYPNQPGYPPPSRQGMGCFAKGCITVVIVVMLLGVVLGGVGWYFGRNVMKFISPTPVPIKTFQATDAQYQDVIARYTEFLKALNAGHAATLSLSSDDLNTLIARDPEFKDVRGKLYMTVEKDEIVAESSFPIPQDTRRFRTSGGGSKNYFNGRMRFAASFSGGELSVFVRRIESMGGDQVSDVFVSAINKMQLNEGFNATLQDERRKGTPWAEAMARVQKIVVENDHIVATAAEGAQATNPVPLPGETPAPTASPSPSDSQ